MTPSRSVHFGQGVPEPAEELPAQQVQEGAARRSPVEVVKLLARRRARGSGTGAAMCGHDSMESRRQRTGGGGCFPVAGPFHRGKEPFLLAKEAFHWGQRSVPPGQ